MPGTGLTLEMSRLDCAKFSSGHTQQSGSQSPPFTALDQRSCETFICHRMHQPMPLGNVLQTFDWPVTCKSFNYLGDGLSIPPQRTIFLPYFFINVINSFRSLVIWEHKHSTTYFAKQLIITVWKIGNGDAVCTGTQSPCEPVPTSITTHNYYVYIISIIFTASWLPGKQ